MKNNVKIYTKNRAVIRRKKIQKYKVCVNRKKSAIFISKFYRVLFLLEELRILKKASKEGVQEYP